MRVEAACQTINGVYSDGPLSVVMKLRGHPSTQMTNLTWPQLTRSWQHRQPEQSQSNSITTNILKQTDLCFICCCSICIPNCSFFFIFLLLFQAPPLASIVSTNACQKMLILPFKITCAFLDNNLLSPSPTYCLRPSLKVIQHIPSCKPNIIHAFQIITLLLFLLHHIC